MLCFDCGGVAEHQHHVVPASRNGSKTIPLCTACHSKVHEKKISGSYLTKLGIVKYQKELLCRIFWLTVIGDTPKEISLSLIEDGETWSVSEKAVKRKIERMKEIDINDLLEVFEPILKFTENKAFTKSAIIDDWEFFAYE